MASTVSPVSRFEVSNWKPFEKNTLRGFVSLTTPSGLVIHGVTFHQKGDARWLSMPAKQYEKNGVTTWTPTVDFTSKAARERFQTEALKALDEFLAGGGQ